MHDHEHGLQEIPNQVPWYYMTGAFLIGAALVQHGCHMVFTAWERELNLPKWFSVVGDVLGIVMAVLLGMLTGHLVWHWSLGGIVGLVGALSSRMVLAAVRARLGIKKQ